MLFSHFWRTHRYHGAVHPLQTRTD